MNDIFKSADAVRERERRLKLGLFKTERAIYLRKEREQQSNTHGGLLAFVRFFWHILEPVDPFIEGWTLDCLCAHLEAISRGDTIVINNNERLFNRLLVNVPPGFMKSLLLNVFFPAWEWGPRGRPHLRYVAFSYASELTERDNAKFRDLICSDAYRELWGHVFAVVGDGKVRVTNDKTGFKFASSFGGVGTGERGHRVLLDDPHKLKGTHESEDARDSVTNWVREAMQNRLNDLGRDAIVVIMQRVHEADTSGVIREHLGDEYCSLIIPMEYQRGVHFSHYLGWNDGEDPRQYDEELAWPERYSADALKTFKRNTYLWAGQYQQNPVPRGGGIFKEEWWQPYAIPESGYYDFTPLFTIASLDTAFKEEEEDDYNALTVWGVYDHPKTGQRRLILMDAWRKRLPMHGKHVQRWQDEDERAFLRRCAPHWGLCEWVNFTCTKRKVDRLIIEDSTRGHDVNAEIRRIFGDRDFGVVLESVNGRGDKWNRGHAVVDLFTDDMIFAPGSWEGDVWMWRDWAQEVITEVCSFPRGVHDDYVDSVVQALRHLRMMMLAIRRDERDFMEKQLAIYKKPLKPLYQV